MEKYLERIEPQGALWGDATPKAADFYFEHWKGTLSDKREDYEFVPGKDRFYRGDCIFSERTVLGKNNCRLTASIERSIELTGSEIEVLLAKTERFRHLFVTLANFMPLWRLGGYSTTNLNLAKGGWGGAYRDFPDLWLNDIRLWYEEPGALERKNERTFELFKINAENYFERFGSWEEYVDNNYLRDFLDKDHEIISLFEGGRRPPGGILDVSQIEDFLENSIRIIEARAKRFAEKDRLR
ncbi:MAG: hypothetical protein FWG41_05850 [Methanomassiliicoccaceae archaeon]|nr:hypothetical protein [Methanomassiliicoccaceae archaeon]